MQEWWLPRLLPEAIAAGPNKAPQISFDFNVLPIRTRGQIVAGLGKPPVPGQATARAAIL